ncbi:dTDP-4-dehydrorhamnose reductase [uncultured Lacinutrix sp.]|uniref:dTDP-4-dehydrorhamnose reductase n=1 Tax=uncultured Lacinutrix sp. TaxID=574032 RepID=UPI00260C6382|nr:dTDP-4-dehydrorhamnose reductase [uncultured Lacinutrix sp.]
MMTNVLVTGGNGQLARTIREFFHNNNDNIQFTFVNKQELDITDQLAISKYFSENSFNYCVNCAAYTNVELAEDFSDKAFQINAEAVKNIAIACKKEKVVLIHISTDYVFDGKKKTPYLETDKTNPINEYGKSKLKGEQYISEILKEHFIIRTSWLYSSYGKNFVKTIINKINENADLKVTTAETGTPTSCIDLAKVIYNIIKLKNVPYTIYHYSNEGEATWYDFAKEIATNFKDYDLDKVSQVAFFKTKATRPKYSVLSKKKLFENTITNNNHWKKALEKIIKILKNE